MTYCYSCDKNISHKSIKRHNKSKTHLYFHKNIVINKYYIGDVLLEDLGYNIIEYIEIYNKKFNCFYIKVDSQINKENNSIIIDYIDGQSSMDKFLNIAWIYYKFCQHKNVIDFLKKIKLGSLKIDNVILKIFSKYKTMTRRYLLNQPRPVLVSKLLKNISNKNFNDKLTKYYFLSKKYELLFYF